MMGEPMLLRSETKPSEIKPSEIKNGSLRVRALGVALTLATLAGASVTSVSLAQDEEFEAPERSVTVDPQAKPRMGIATQAAKQVPYRAEASGLGVVIGLDVIAQTEADLETAEAAARASRAALARAQALFGADLSTSRQSLETAEKQAAADEAQLSLTKRKAIAVWGPSAPWRDPRQRTSVLAALGAGKTVVVRGTFPAETLAGGSPESIRVERLDDGTSGKSWSASKVWRAPADPTMPGRTYYMMIPGSPDLAAGDRVRVLAQVGVDEKGAFVPSSAIVIAEGRSWLYIEEKANYFVRQAADLSKPFGDGYVMSSAVQVGEPIVIKGAGQLLARETGSAED